MKDGSAMNQTPLRIEAFGWRQVQPEARLSPRASANPLDPSSTVLPAQQAPLPPPPPAASRPGEVASVVSTAGGNSAHQQDSRRPTVFTQGPPHHYARLQPRDLERSVISPLTPSIDVWRARTSNDVRSIRISPSQLSANLPSASESGRSISISGQSIRDDSPARTASTTQSNTLSLPSFAKFRDSTQGDKPYTTAFATTSSKSGPSSGAVSCSCADLYPLVHIAADAGRSLNSALHRYVIRLDDKFHDAPKGTPVQILQHLIDQLVSVETELRRMRPNESAGTFCINCHTSLSASDKSPMYLKRPADFDNYETSKRMRTDVYDTRRSPAGHQPPSRSNSRDGRCRSSSPLTLRPMEVAQPTPHQRTQANRLLPSPSSLVHPTTGFATRSRIDASASPPASSYQPSSSLHNASTSSVASQHIANLERQISLTSLSLQSLRDEHTNLLQKWHRERTKIQTIEKKCQIGDAEINDLAAKNEELTEQIKALEHQLAETERKRDDEARSAARDKDQWRRILEMSDRLSTESDKRSQRLKDDNARLEGRVLWFENESQARMQRNVTVAGDAAATRTTPTFKPTGSRPGSAHGEPFIPGERSRPDLHSLAWSLSKTNMLQLQVDELRSALEDAQRQDTVMEEKFKELDTHRQSLSKVIDNALAARREPTASQLPGNQFRATAPVAQRKLQLDEESTLSNDTEKILSADVPNRTELPNSHRSAATSSVEAFLTGDPAIQVQLGQPTLTASADELFKALGPPPACSNSRGFS